MAFDPDTYLKEQKTVGFDEVGFQTWYAEQAQKTGLDPNPDDPRHKYDYRAAYTAGVEPAISRADNKYHWDSRFKADDHPNRFVGGVDTKTGKKTGFDPDAYLSEVDSLEPPIMSMMEKAKEIGKGALRMPERVAEQVGNVMEWSADYRMSDSWIPAMRVYGNIGKMIQPEWHRRLSEANRDVMRSHGEKVSKYWQTAAETGIEAPSEKYQKQTWASAFGTKALTGAIESSGSFLAGIATGYITKNPQLGIIMLSTMSGGSAFKKQKEKGVKPEIAQNIGLLTAAWEGLTEQVPFEIILNPTSKSMLKRFLKGGTVESLQEWIQGIGENLFEYFGYNLKDWKSIPAALKAAVPHLMDNWLDNVTAGFLMGGGAAAAIGPRGGAGQVKQEQVVPEQVAQELPETGEKLLTEFDQIIQGVSEGKFDASVVDSRAKKEEAVLRKVYSKGFVAKLTSIRNNADNIVAGAGNKELQIKIMKSDLAEMQKHYDNISEDIKGNPELLAELGRIEKLLPGYAYAVNSFVKLPSKEGFEQIKTVSGQIAGLSNEYGARLGEQAPTEALPAAQQDAAETISRSKAEYVARSEELRNLEYEQLLELVNEGDELAAQRIQEMDAEAAVEQGLPTFEVLFEQMLEGDEVAKTALANGEYKGGRARQKELEATPAQDEGKQGLTGPQQENTPYTEREYYHGISGRRLVEFQKTGKIPKAQQAFGGNYSLTDDYNIAKSHAGDKGIVLKVKIKDDTDVDIYDPFGEDEPTGHVSDSGESEFIVWDTSKVTEPKTFSPAQNKSRVDPTIPATAEQVRNFATIKVHALAKMLGVNKNDRQRIQQDIVGKKSLKDMDLDEAKRVEAYFVAEAKKRGLSTSTGKELAAVVKSFATQKNVQEVSGVKPVAWKRMLQTPGRIVSQFMHQTRRVERMLEALDGFTEGPVYNSIWTPTHTQLVNSRTSYTNRVGKFKEALVDILTPELNTEAGVTAATEMIQAEEEAAGKKARKLGKRAIRKLVGDSLWARHITGGREIVLEATDTNPELSLTPSERIGVYLAMKNEDSRNHLFAGNFAVFTDPAVVALEVVQNMSVQEKQIGDWILADLGTNFKRANQASILGLGRELNQQDNYFPIRVIDVGTLQTKDFLSSLEDKYTKQAFKAEPSEVKERLKGATQAVDLDSFSVYLNHLKRIEQFIHMAPVAKSVGNILNTREFRQAVNNTTAGHGAGILDRWLKNAIRGHAVDPGIGLAAKTLLWSRQKGVLYSLAFNVASVARQFISGFNAVATHPTILAYAAQNMTKSMDPRYYKQLESRMRELSPEMETRSFERYLANIKHQAQAAGILVGKKQWSEKALSWQRWADRRTVVVAWNSFYDAARESESVQKMFDLDGSDEAAIAYANKMIGRTQPMGDVEHLPDFFTRGPIERLLSTFMNQVNNNWNFWAHDIYGMRKAGKISRKMVAYRVLFSSILPAMMFGAISRAGPPDDWKDALFDWAAYSVSPIFLLGRLAIDAVLGFAGGQTSVEDILPTNLSKTMGAVVRGDPKKAALYGVKTVGGLTGRIPNQVLRTFLGILDIITGETDDLRRLIWSDWSLTKYGWPEGAEESKHIPR